MISKRGCELLGFGGFLGLVIGLVKEGCETPHLGSFVLDSKSVEGMIGAP